MAYSLDVIGTFKTFVASLVGKVAALANVDQARKRSDGPSMEFRGKKNVFLDRKERRRPSCCKKRKWINAAASYTVKSLNSRGAAETDRVLRTPERPATCSAKLDPNKPSKSVWSGIQLLEIPFNFYLFIRKLKEFKYCCFSNVIL